MVTTLIGDNHYLINSKISQAIAEFKKNNDHLAVERISVEETDFVELCQSLNAQSLFSSSRLIILDQPSLSKDFVKSAESILESLPESTDLIIVEPSIDKRSSYYKLLLKNTSLEDCTKIDEPSLIKWIVDQVKILGGNITNPDAKHLVQRAGDDQMLLFHEIEKLVIYDKNVKKESIDLLSVESSASTIFQLLDAVFNYQTAKALTIYDKQRLARVQPEQILAMFVWQLHLISVCLSARNLNLNEIASRTKISPFSLRNSMQIAKKLDLDSLKRTIRNLLNIDYSSKTISFDLDQALKNFIVESSTVI